MISKMLERSLILRSFPIQLPVEFVLLDLIKYFFFPYKDKDTLETSIKMWG